MIIKFFKYFLSIPLVCSYYFCFGAEFSEKIEPKERLEAIDEKIEESKKKSLEEERTIKKAQDDLKKYSQNLKNAKSLEQKKIFEKENLLNQNNKTYFGKQVPLDRLLESFINNKTALVNLEGYVDRNRTEKEFNLAHLEENSEIKQNYIITKDKVLEKFSWFSYNEF